MIFIFICPKASAWYRWSKNKYHESMFTLLRGPLSSMYYHRVWIIYFSLLLNWIWLWLFYLSALRLWLWSVWWWMKKKKTSFIVICLMLMALGFRTICTYLTWLLFRYAFFKINRKYSIWIEVIVVKLTKKKFNICRILLCINME